jgi:transposase InsO family protein
VLVVLDHFTREALGLRAFSKEPSGEDLVALLSHVSRKTGHVPNYTVTDKGSQFFNSRSKAPAGAFGAWCKENSVRPRFGAVGRHGSIAVVERFMRTLKSEGTRKLPLIPLSLPRFQEFLGDFSVWYNEHRPHSALSGRTPREVRLALPPPVKRLRWEPRPRYPIANSENVARVTHLALRVEAFRGRPSLPVVSLQLAA